MSWAALASDDVPNDLDIEDAVLNGFLHWIGAAPPSELFGDDHVWEDSNYVDWIIGADAVGPAGGGSGDEWPNKAEVEAWALPASPANFQATRDLGACPGSEIDLSWTASATRGTVIEYRQNGTGSWTQIATPAAGVGSYTDSVHADKTQTNNYRIRWDVGSLYSEDDQAPWVCPS